MASKKTISAGLRADIMREEMESKNTLEHKGGLYVGKGTSHTVGGETIHETDEVYPGNNDNGKPLVADSSAPNGVKFGQVSNAGIGSQAVDKEKLGNILDEDGKESSSNGQTVKLSQKANGGLCISLEGTPDNAGHASTADNATNATHATGAEYAVRAATSGIAEKIDITEATTKVLTMVPEYDSTANCNKFYEDDSSGILFNDGSRRISYGLYLVLVETYNTNAHEWTSFPLGVIPITEQRSTSDPVRVDFGYSSTSINNTLQAKELVYQPVAGLGVKVTHVKFVQAVSSAIHSYYDSMILKLIYLGINN